MSATKEFGYSIRFPVTIGGNDYSYAMKKERGLPSRTIKIYLNQKSQSQQQQQQQQIGNKNRSQADMQGTPDEKGNAINQKDQDAFFKSGLQHMVDTVLLIQETLTLTSLIVEHVFPRNGGGSLSGGQSVTTLPSTRSLSSGMHGMSSRRQARPPSRPLGGISRGIIIAQQQTPLPPVPPSRRTLSLDVRCEAMLLYAAPFIEKLVITTNLTKAKYDEAFADNNNNKVTFSFLHADDLAASFMHHPGLKTIHMWNGGTIDCCQSWEMGQPPGQNDDKIKRAQQHCLESLRALQHAILFLPNLRELDCIHLFDTDLIRNVVCQPKMRSLIVHDCSFRDEPPEAQRTSFITALASPSATVTHLEWHHGLTPFWASEFRRALLTNTSLTKISFIPESLHTNDYNDETSMNECLLLGEALGQHSSLQEFEFTCGTKSFPPRWTDDTTKSNDPTSPIVGRLLRNTRSLRSLTLSDFRATNRICHAFISNLPVNESLRKLILKSPVLVLSPSSDSGIRNNDDPPSKDVQPVNQIARDLGLVLGRHSSLEHLELVVEQSAFYPSSCHEPYADLISGLSLSKTLQSLKLISFSATDPLCTALQQVLQQGGLTRLEIEGRQTRNAWLERLVPSLQCCCRLQSLILSEANVCLSEIENGTALLALLSVLHNRYWKDLTELQLHFPRVACRLASVIDFLASFKSESKLEKLVLNFVHQQDACPQRFLNAVKQNYILKYFRGFRPFVPAEYSTVVEGILAMNQAERAYILDRGKNVKVGINVLAAASSNLDCLFIHLRENPDLCSCSADLDAMENPMKWDRK